MTRLTFAAGAAIAIVAAFVACEDGPRYVYTAQHFDEANGCLEAYTPVERVPGEGVSVRCAPVCMTVKDKTGIYVSPVCPPLPEIATEVPASDPSCQAALDAFKAGSLCAGATTEDGGYSAGDSGQDEDSSSDAGVTTDAAEEI